MITAGQTVGGRYTIMGPIGRGGMGSVYRAVQQPLGRPVAIKVLRVEGLSAAERHHRQQRFFREAALSSRLNHPNTITVYDYGELPDGEGFFLAMELLEGQTLSEVIKARRHLTVAMMLHVSAQIASSLSDAHAAGVIHRDLKPPNVMLVSRGANPFFVKVLDFGLVKETAASSNTAELTGAQTVLGSPMYMAPERFLSHTADTPAVDVYALGVLMYEMLVGRPPFLLGGDVTLHHVMMQHIKAPPPRMKDLAPSLYLPQGLEAVVMRCLEKDPHRRYATMDALLMDLAAFQQNNRLLRTDPELTALASQSGEDLDVTVDSIPIQLETGPLARNTGDETLVDARISAAGIAASAPQARAPERAPLGWESGGWESAPYQTAPVPQASPPAPFGAPPSHPSHPPFSPHAAPGRDGLHPPALTDSPYPSPLAFDPRRYAPEPMPAGHSHEVPMHAVAQSGTTQIGRPEAPPAGLGTRNWFLIGSMALVVGTMLVVVNQFTSEINEGSLNAGSGRSGTEQIPESVAKRLNPTSVVTSVSPQDLEKPDVGVCSGDFESLCEGEHSLVGAFSCLAQQRSSLSTECVNHLIQLEKSEYKGLLLRSEARTIPSVRLDPIAERLLSGDNAHPVLCQQGQEVALHAPALAATESKDPTIVRITGGKDASLACFSAGTTTLSLNQKTFEFIVGREDLDVADQLLKTHAKKFETCVMADVKESFKKASTYRVAIAPDGSVKHVESVSSTMPVKTELCGAAVLQKVRADKDKHWRVVDVAWDGMLPAYMGRVVEHVRAARYSDAAKLCRPLLEADVMTNECAPLGEDFPTVVRDGCRYLGDSTKAIFNCAKEDKK